VFGGDAGHHSVASLVGDDGDERRWAGHPGGAVYHSRRLVVMQPQQASDGV
jgi:hypothetical protein